VKDFLSGVSFPSEGGEELEPRAEVLFRRLLFNPTARSLRRKHLLDFLAAARGFLQFPAYIAVTLLYCFCLYGILLVDSRLMRRFCRSLTHTTYSLPHVPPVSPRLLFAWSLVSLSAYSSPLWLLRTSPPVFQLVKSVDGLVTLPPLPPGVSGSS